MASATVRKKARKKASNVDRQRRRNSSEFVGVLGLEF